MIDHVVITCDESNPIEARIEVRLDHDNSQDVVLAGTVEGPTCVASHTLPATIPLRSNRSSTTLESVAIIPDPCFWTPELPFLYRLRLELIRDGQVLEQTERVVGLRRRGRDGIVCDQPALPDGFSPGEPS